MKTVVIQIGKTGDIIALLPCLKAESDLGNRCSVMVLEKYAPLFDGVSYADAIPIKESECDLRTLHAKAQTLGERVISTYMGPNLDDTREFTFKPSGTETATTDSFVKELWRLAGHLPLWKKQPPVIFDQRNLEREEATFAKLKKQLGFKKGNTDIVLLSLGGETSPFPYKELLKELLYSRPSARRRIVDLAEINVERFYDLIGFYEIAQCLITTDSAPLHLAQAVPTLPVFALVNDSPSSWHGSAWKPNHIFQARYKTFPQEAVKMIERLDALGQPGCINKRQILAGEFPRIIHVVSGADITDDNRTQFNEARVSWLKQYVQGMWTESVIDYGAPGRDSKTALKDDKRFPFLKDIIRLAAMRAADRDILCLTRGVTHLGGNATQWILENPLCYSHRHIIAKETGATSFHPATDVFCFTKEWWALHRNEVPDLILGNDHHWHRVLLEVMKKHSAKEIPALGYRYEVAKASVPGTRLLPPRLLHNQVEHDKFMARENVKHLFKPAMHQQPTVNLNRHALFQFGYNPSLIRFENRLLMAYRHHSGNANSALAMAELSESLEVLSNRPIRNATTHGSMEDPRLFEFRDQLWVSFVDAKLNTGNVRCQIRVGRLVEGNPWGVEDVWTPEYGNNDGSSLEKNWLFFSHDDKLLAVHSQGPLERIVLEFDGKKIAAEHRSPSLNVLPSPRKNARWAFGVAKGGAAPLPFGDRLVQVFHSTLDNEPPPFRRRYYIGACTIDPKPPYGVLSFSHEPFLFGSESDDSSEIERSSCGHRKEKVVFPAGLAWSKPGMEENAWLSYGVNDCQCAISTIRSFKL